MCIPECVCKTERDTHTHQHHHDAIKQSIRATISPFHGLAEDRPSVRAQTVKAIDHRYIIRNDLCCYFSPTL